MDPHTFDRYAREHEDEWLEDLSSLCSLPSVSAQGRMQAETADWVSDRLQQVGFATEQISEGGSPPVVWAEGGSGSRTLLYYNHYDVQPPEPLELWESDPFVVTPRDGRLFARGIADNKGDLLARIHAIEAWKATQGELPLRIRFLAEGEEEIGSPHLEQILATHGHRWAADGCIWEGGGKDDDETPQIHCGAKGMLYVELHVRTLERDLHSAYGGMVPNAIGRLMEAIRCLRDEEGRVIVPGIREHVRPFTEAERAAVEAIPCEAGKMKARFGASRLVNDVDGAAAMEQLINGPTANVAGMWGGYVGKGAKTIVPAEATAKMDFRLVPDLTVEIADRLVREHLKRSGFEDVEVRFLSGQNPGRTPVDAPIVNVAREVWSDLGEPAPHVHPNMAGTGPISLFTKGLELPTIMACGVSWPGDRIHSPNESIRRADYLNTVRFWGRFIDRFSRLTD